MKLTYRPEIDGLRAVAVGGVILYHAQINVLGRELFKNGYLGVDIFFVISGYLISSFLFKELNNTGSISFKNFYEKRIRRILPALLFVMLTSIPFAWLYLLPIDLIDYSKSILSSLGFISNFYFYISSHQYGAPSGLLKPFLHTWSLSIEEQFYIIFPLILLILFRYFKNSLIYILVLIFLLSLTIFLFLGKNFQLLNFYFLLTRMWELLAGSFLAYLEIRNGRNTNNKTLNFILPNISFLIIGFLLIFNNNTINYINIPLIIISTCIIIWFSNSKELTTKILSTKLFVGVGLISYSLYLWHYPIFAFSKLALAPRDLTKTIFVLFIFFSLSIISYYFVEKPFRNKIFKFRFIIIPIILAYFILFILNFNFLKNNGFNDRFPKIFNHQNEKTWLLLKNENNENCFERKNFCKVLEGNKKVYLIGDSSTGSLALNLYKNLKKRNFTFITSYWGRCLLFPGFDLLDRNTASIYGNCSNELYTNIYKILKKEENAIIIIGGRFPSHIRTNEFISFEAGFNDFQNNIYKSKGTYNNIETSFKEMIRNISKKNKVILIYPIPEVGYDIPKKVFDYYLSGNLDLKDTETFFRYSYEIFKDKSKKVYELFDSLNFENVIKVKPENVLCNTIIKGKCEVHDKTNMYYIDGVHLSYPASILVNDLIISKIDKLE